MEEVTISKPEPEEPRSFPALVEAFNEAVDNVEQRSNDLDEAREHPEKYTEDEVRKLVEELNGASAQAERLQGELNSKEARDRARNQFKKFGISRVNRVEEPDIYTEHSEVRFFTDLYRSQVLNDPIAGDRISRHQQHEVEKRAITSATLGGIIPAQYLVDLYAKAARNGRVFADQCNRQALPDVGMSLIIPRLTAGLSAAAQTTQNTAVVTTDVTEADLTVAVNTIAGYSPVSRQAIERAAYSDRILFEDLTARYWAVLDSYCLNGTGSNNQPTGLLNTGSISSSTASTATAVGIYPKIADVVQQIATAVGGLGYTADKIFMHPRRWGQFEAALDTTGRPLIAVSGPAYNQIANEGPEVPIGPVGQMMGLQVYVDPNIPTTLGATTNTDAVIVMASNVVHLFERASDPMTLTFEQPLGNQLEVQLVCYGYIAFTAGRYPAASGAVTGAGLAPPAF